MSSLQKINKCLFSSRSLHGDIAKWNFSPVFSHYYRFELVPREMQNTFNKNGIEFNWSSHYPTMRVRILSWNYYYYGHKSNEMNVMEFQFVLNTSRCTLTKSGPLKVHAHELKIIFLKRNFHPFNSFPFSSYKKI